MHLDALTALEKNPGGQRVHVRGAEAVACEKKDPAGQVEG